VKPDLGAVIWDCGLPERRTTLQPEYKQNRPSMPDEMRSQEAWLQKNVPLFGPASLHLPNTEADDLIASYALVAQREGIEVIVATNDKDILQIASPMIRIYSTAKTDVGTAGHALLGEAEVRVKWGVDPARIGDVLALTGDTSDNIPGVPGVGEKTAAQLIRDFGTIDGLLERTAEIKSDKVRDKILAARDLILANRQMVALDEDLPLPVPVSSLALRPDFPALIDAVRECEFKSLLKEIETEAFARTVPSQGELL
jgi:DNA polymerase-1